MLANSVKRWRDFMDDIEQKDARRFQILEKAYALMEKNSDSLFNQEDIQQALGLSADELNPVMEYLTNEGLFKEIAFGGVYEITHRGIKEYEQAIRQPTERTEHFPAFTEIHNIINIERMEQSQIQQGTVNSSQEQVITDDKRQRLHATIAESRPLIADFGDPGSREEMMANVDTAAAQLRRNAPSTPIVRESFRSLRTVAEQVGASLIAERTIALLQAFVGCNEPNTKTRWRVLDPVLPGRSAL
jgi:hypothetical protein